MKVAIYVRVSTDEQANKGNSIPEQKERLIAYCKSQGWDDYDIFEDDGYSAKDTNRPKLQEMLDNISNYSTVITTKIDRLCRNLLDLLNIIDFLEENKCNYASSSESFDTSSPAGRMVLQILGAFAEFERERIRERVKDNMHNIARKTKKVITRPCFGYDVIDGKYLINEVEANHVRQMVDWLFEGIGARGIANRLNSLGVRTKDGNEFSDDSVRKLLKRDTLMGTMVYGKSYTHKNKVLSTPENEWIINEEHHEGILDKETFDKVQDILQSRKTQGKQVDNERWLLSGLVRCSHCGSKMVGQRRKKGNREYFLYMCSRYHKKSECFRHYVWRDEFEQTIISYIKDVPKFIMDGKEIEINVNSNIGKIDTKHLHDKLGKINKKMQRQIALYEDDDISIEDFRIAKDRLESEREAIVKEISELEKDTFEAKKGQISDKINELAKDLDSPDRSIVKNALRQLLDCATVTNFEDVKVTLKV